MLNPRKELKREQRARSGEWRVNIFFSGRIPRDTGGCRRVIFNKHQKGPGIDNSESFWVQ